MVGRVSEVAEIGWRGNLRVNGHPPSRRRQPPGYALARGYGGQVVAVVPDLALSVVITSDPTRPARSQGYFGDLMALFADTVLPAARAA
ncbi:hypothetical protein [Mangrovicoccus ximenensis]|uniref:hypothetical protein n=1 Tax=Mangrovicoccus ximenensis TaxID=1911570 RepID=UPI0038B307D3